MARSSSENSERWYLACSGLLIAVSAFLAVMLYGGKDFPDSGPLSFSNPAASDVPAGALSVEDALTRCYPFGTSGNVKIVAGDVLGRWYYACYQVIGVGSSPRVIVLDAAGNSVSNRTVLKASGLWADFGVIVSVKGLVIGWCAIAGVLILGWFYYRKPRPGPPPMCGSGRASWWERRSVAWLLVVLPIVSWIPFAMTDSISLARKVRIIGQATFMAVGVLAGIQLLSSLTIGDPWAQTILGLIAAALVFAWLGGSYLLTPADFDRPDQPLWTDHDGHPPGQNLPPTASSPTPAIDWHPPVIAPAEGAHFPQFVAHQGPRADEAWTAAPSAPPAPTFALPPRYPPRSVYPRIARPVLSPAGPSEETLRQFRAAARFRLGISALLRWITVGLCALLFTTIPFFLGVVLLSPIMSEYRLSLLTVAVIIWFCICFMIIPGLATAVLAVPLIVGWKDPARILVLRPFNRPDHSRPLRGLVRREVAGYGHVYTLSDVAIKVRWYITIPAVLGQLSTLSFRHRRIAGSEELSHLANSVSHRGLRNMNWVTAHSKVFAIRSTDNVWKEAVRQMVDQSNALLIDLTDLSSNLAWELDLIRQLHRLDDCMFIARQDRAAQSSTAAGQQLGRRIQTFGYDPAGRLLAPLEFTRALSAILLRTSAEVSSRF